MNCSKAFGVLTPFVILVIWFALLLWWTRGFSAFTTYPYTLEAAGALPRPAPAFPLTDQFGNEFNTNELRGKFVLLTFAYLNCPVVCSITTGKMLGVHYALGNRIPDDLELVSISFDRERDTPPMLYQAWQRHGSPGGWRMSVLAEENDPDQQEKLEQLGVWVFRRDDGLYNHSAYFFLLDSAGQVIHVMKPDQSTKEIVKTVRQFMQ